MPNDDDKERDAARERVKGWMKDHEVPGPDPDETKDDSLTDPKHNEGKDE